MTNNEARAEGTDGSVHVPELTIPPSDLWSEEFRLYHLSQLTRNAGEPSFPVPARTAVRSAWEDFDAWKYARNHAGPLASLRERHAVEVDETTIDGVRVATVTPRRGIARDNSSRVLINLHGGGFVYNRGLSVGQLESIPVAALGEIKVVTLDYRQAPFHRYPAATEDVERVYRALLRQYEHGAIGIFGCSAGGALTAQAIASFEARGLPRPGAAGVFCIGLPPPCVPPPWGRGWGDSALWLPTVAPGNQLSEADRAMWEPTSWYMEGVELSDPLAYPGSSDEVLTHFPPTLFLSGTRDFAMSPAVASHARLLRLGVDSSLYIMEGAGHSAHVFAVGTPEAHDAHAYVARWFNNHLG